ncbi:MAG: hypothetical protein CFE26_27025, partial [Verrucomicrobiales bacterium VVV1]
DSRAPLSISGRERNVAAGKGRDCGRTGPRLTMGGMIVGVHPLAGFDKVLHYLVPEPMRADVQVGALVRVPVGRTLRLGIVGEIGAPKDFPIEKLKALAQVLHPFPALPPDLLGLARWMTGYYAAPLDGIIET